MAEKTVTVCFQKEKDTKNTVKFAEVPEEGKPQIVGSLYVQKWFAGNSTKIAMNMVAE